MADVTTNRIDAKVTIGPFVGIAFHAISDGAVTAPSVRDRSPGDKVDHPVESLATLEQFTTTCTYDHTTYGPFRAWCKANLNTVGTVGRIIRGPDTAQIGIETCRAMLKECGALDGDSRDNDGKAEWTLTWDPYDA